MGHVEVFTTEGNSFPTDTGDCRRSEDPNDENLFCADVPNADAFMASMHDILARFINVLALVAKPYGLSLTLLHVLTLLLDLLDSIGTEASSLTCGTSKHGVSATLPWFHGRCSADAGHPRRPGRSER